jgi:hypothetical protein
MSEPLPQGIWRPTADPCTWHKSAAAQVCCAACDRPACPHCLIEAPAPGDGPGEDVTVAVCPVCAPLYGVESSVPFEQPARSFLGGFFTTWGWAISNPNALWRAFPHDGVGRATLFALLASVPVGLVFSCCLGGVYLAFALDSSTGRLDEETSLAVVIGLAAVWGLTLLFPLLLAALSLPVQLVARIGGTTTPWPATYRIMCYLTAVRITAIPAAMIVAVFASVIPGGGLIGNLGPEVWHAIVLHHALRRVHGISGGAALAAVVLPPLMLCSLMAVPIVIALAFA